MDAKMQQRAGDGPRAEDAVLVRGHGRYAADVPLPKAYAYFLRSPHAFARIVSIDVMAAEERLGWTAW